MSRKNKSKAKKIYYEMKETKPVFVAPEVDIPENIVENYRWLFTKTQAELLDILPKMMEKYYSEEKIIAIPDFILVEGTIPICLVAHMDTVHITKPTETQLVYNILGHSYSSPFGIGADDRAGIIAILEILKKGFRPHIIFTTDEEIGGLGADMFTNVFPKFPFDLKYFIQIDRKGNGEAVFYDCDNGLFELYINDAGFHTEIGSFTDIATFMQFYDIAGVTISAGYLDEHTKTETLYVGALEYTIAGVIRLLEDAPNAEYFDAQISYESYVYSNWNYNYGTYSQKKETDSPSKIGYGIWDDEAEEGFENEPINDIYKQSSLYGLSTVVCTLCGEEFEADLESFFIKCPHCNAIQSSGKKY